MLCNTETTPLLSNIAKTLLGADGGLNDATAAAPVGAAATANGGGVGVAAAAASVLPAMPQQQVPPQPFAPLYPTLPAVEPTPVCCPQSLPLSAFCFEFRIVTTCIVMHWCTVFMFDCGCGDCEPAISSSGYSRLLTRRCTRILSCEWINDMLSSKFAVVHILL